MCWVLKLTLELTGHSVTIAPNAREALELTVHRGFPLAFIDARLPDMDGLQLATKISAQNGKMRIIVISGYYSADDPSIMEAIRATRIAGFLAKPFEIEAIEAALAGVVSSAGGE
jgi:DNA-binding NtrC family response regulator